MQAWQLNQTGWRQAKIAVVLDVGEVSISWWIRWAHRDWLIASLRHRVFGCSSELESEQIRLIPDFLAHGLETDGFLGEIWTCTRIRQGIEKGFGVTYHKSQGFWLAKKFHWTPQNANPT